MAKATEARKGAVFVVLVLSLALGAALLIRLLEIDSEFTGALLYMTTPTVATIVMLLVVTRDGWSRDGWRSLGLHRSRRRTWPLAAGVTFLASLVASMIVWLTPLAAFQVPEGAADELINFLINVAIMTLTIVLAEEIGWRGYLLPRLRGLGRNRSLRARRTGPRDLAPAAGPAHLALPRRRAHGRHRAATCRDVGGGELRLRLPAPGLR